MDQHHQTSDLRSMFNVSIILQCTVTHCARYPIILVELALESCT